MESNDRLAPPAGNPAAKCQSPEDAGPRPADIPCDDVDTSGGGTPTSFGGHCYLLKENLSGWSESKSWCDDRGTGWQLALIETAEESDYLSSIIYDSSSMLQTNGWDFGHRKESGVWKGIGGESLGSWAESVLSTSGDDCSHMRYDRPISPSGENWDKRGCGEGIEVDIKKSSAICEFTPPT